MSDDDEASQKDYSGKTQHKQVKPDNSPRKEKPPRDFHLLLRCCRRSCVSGVLLFFLLHAVYDEDYNAVQNMSKKRQGINGWVEDLPVRQKSIGNENGRFFLLY